MRASISPFSGKRFNAFFEKIKSSSKQTSNTPPPLEISDISNLGNDFFKLASRLDALGR
tara:strand:- start:1318 stop:1494 length:177 start_codon:yes stop_codon:yes gene_type:complete